MRALFYSKACSAGVFSVELSFSLHSSTASKTQDSGLVNLLRCEHSHDKITPALQAIYNMASRDKSDVEAFLKGIQWESTSTLSLDAML